MKSGNKHPKLLSSQAGALWKSISNILTEMGYPDDYKNIAAHEESIEQAREVKENNGLTWTEFLRKGATELSTGD